MHLFNLIMSSASKSVFPSGSDPLFPNKRRGIDVFTDTAAIFHLLDLRSIMGCPGGMNTIWYTHSVYVRALFGPIFLCNGIAMGLQWEKKIVVPCLDVIMNTFFPRNIQWSSLFARKVPVNTERVPPGHPIILYNMAAVLVKRSIFFHYFVKNCQHCRKASPSLLRRGPMWRY